MSSACGKATFKVQIYSSCGGSQKIASCVNPNPEILGAFPPSTISDHHIPNENEMTCPGHVQKPAGLDYFTSGGSRLTKAQDNSILEIARTIMSETPLYVAVINQSNVELEGCSISLPSGLMKYVGGVFKGTVKLEAPDSNVYSVSATQQSDENDIVVFRHKGYSRLEIFVLDRNGCRKTPLLFGMKDVIDPPHETVDIIDLSSCSSDDDNIVAACTTKPARLQKLQLDQHETHEDLHAPMEVKVDRSTVNSNSSEGLSQRPYVISRKVSLARAQEKKVPEKVQATQSRFPIFVAIMSRSNTSERSCSRLRFTMEYARRCLPSATQGLTLQLEGCQSEEWQTVLHVQGGHSSARDFRTITCGWAEFAAGNNLRLRDICVFELVTVTRLKMKVHIIRKSGDHA
ncbi:hypothetical protein BS78_K199500 [Paspalum vaginatum]|uniref:TF-B3 domain-containing protein n=1 Tax=Paspalum vaginatum TaxID=158149 RepID=A0A9W7XBI2_9POAL|nr:hypothetical protein BS78_K199500 [Paspalum vaginatum]